MEFTEADVFLSICQEAGVAFLDKTAARALLHKRIAKEPAWLAVLPESLLGKLGIGFDHIFDAKELALAAAIGGCCVRRILL